MALIQSEWKYARIDFDLLICWLVFSILMFDACSQWKSFNLLCLCVCVHTIIVSITCSLLFIIKHITPFALHTFVRFFSDVEHIKYSFQFTILLYLLYFHITCFCCCSCVSVDFETLWDPYEECDGASNIFKGFTRKKKK